MRAPIFKEKKMTRTYLGSSGCKRHYKELRRRKKRKINYKLLLMSVLIALTAVGLHSCMTEYNASVDGSVIVREIDGLRVYSYLGEEEQDEIERFILEAPPPGRKRTEAQVRADYE